MIIHKGHRFRLSLSEEQKTLCARTAGICRWLWNLALEQRTLAWQNGRHSVGFAAQCAELPGLKDAAPWLREAPSHCLQQVLRDLDQAFQNCFAGRTAYPVYRKKFQNDFFRFQDPKQFEVNEAGRCRKREGSRNRAKARARLAELQIRIARRRRDAIHKASTKLAKNHGLIVIEDLRIKAMTASARGTLEAPGTNVSAKAGLNRAMLNVAFGEIRRQLEYKCGWYGSTPSGDESCQYQPAVFAVRSYGCRESSFPSHLPLPVLRPWRQRRCQRRP